MNDFKEHLTNSKLLHVQQVWEGFEIVLGWESRNKYRILDEHQKPVAFAAEQSAGIAGALMRQVFGHWRSFKVTIFNEQKQKVFDLNFPFRWFFKTLIVTDVNGATIGHLEERFAIFRKKFDVYDNQNRIVAKINSSFFKFWTFEFFDGGRSLGKIQKKWSGMLGEIFTDKDNFVVTFTPMTNPETKALMLATCLMVDIIYFENNQGGGSILDLAT